MSCHDHAVLKATSQCHGTARHGHGHGMCELASGVQRRNVGDLPASAFFRLPCGVPRRLLSKHTNPLNCRTSSSDISGYHADFHEGHGTAGEQHGNGMLVAWALHEMCVLAFTDLQKDPQCDSLNIHPLIHGLFRRIILYSYSKLGANFSGRSPVSWLCYVELQTRCKTISSTSLVPYTVHT
jgi:hypothetical protein